MIKVICKICNKGFKISKTRFKTGRGKYCSHKCRLIGLHQNTRGEKSWNWKGGKIIKKCLNCKKDFRVYKNREKDNRGKFCSKKCKCDFGHTEETCRKMSLNQIGRTAWNEGKACPQLQGIYNGHWTGGRITDKNGYILIYVQEGHPFGRGYNKRYVLEHRLVFEKHIDRYLTPQEVIHHINNIKSDNRIENLMLFANSIAHLNYHRMLKKTST